MRGPLAGRFVLQRSTMGLGPALRKARVKRGVSIEEASRDTRIRAEFLEALEEEDFDRLLGDVHVRGCLRSYSTYLGLPSDRVLEVYGQHAEEGLLSAQAPRQAPEGERGVRRRRDNHRLVIMAAAAILLLAGAFGVLSARDPAPKPAQLPTTAPLEQTAPHEIQVTVLARQSVEVTVTIDGREPRSYALAQGEGRSFEASSQVTIRLSSGATAQVTVAGKDLGFPGKEGKPWRETFSYGSGSPTPTPAG
jgi:hypothetical protein